MNIQTLKEASDCLLNLAKPETQAIEHIYYKMLLNEFLQKILQLKFRCLLLPKAHMMDMHFVRLTQPLLHRNIL